MGHKELKLAYRFAAGHGRSVFFGEFVGNQKPSTRYGRLRTVCSEARSVHGRGYMKRASLIVFVVTAFSAFAAVSFAIYIPPTHYEQPPAAKSKPDWPDGLAEAIADKSYVDGWSHANPGFVVEMNDTFFFDGDSEALGKFIEKLRAVKKLDVKITFTKAAGWASEFVRAGIVFQGKVMGQDMDRLGGKPCSWLVTVTDNRWAESSGRGSNARARLLIFLGSPKIDAERLEF
jgi:hypothetical protein